ncbi:cortactin-binding protein 2-like isoform X2 [Liolophura sinensis]|uniref:cortactin-binding protein 2-like isoform X2 n=1 Tax=Liolophura sinensis TaxID=3198878 RepID=UPI003158DD4B
MASRNIRGASPTPTVLKHDLDASPFDPTDKIQSNTLKRHPKMDLSKSDLLKLLSYLEGELQARDVVIATLKAEKAKQLLYQAKYGRFGLGDPFMALQRDSDNMKDSSFDETAIKLMYDNQLAQLENLIATQRKAQVKMREQLNAAEKRFHKATAELEDEKRKHAQDTAQGDDVTYMLEKERERLKQEVDFEKNQNKRLEKDLKKSLASLEEERANSGKHKQVALMLIKERKKLEDILLLEKHKRSTAESLLNSDKTKIRDIVDGLEEENKRSLKMEAVMEKKLSEFDVEREQLRNKFSREESRSCELQASVESLTQQLEAMQLQLSQERAASCAKPQSIEIRSSVSPSKTKEGSREGSHASSQMAVPGLYATPQLRKPVTPAKPTDKPLASNSLVVGQGDLGPANTDTTSPRGAINSGTTGSAMFTMPSGGKVSVHVGGSGVGNSPRKPVAAGRGTPPPIPPNKPVLTSPLPGGISVAREGVTRAVSPKPVPPPKVGIALSKDRPGGVQSDGQGDMGQRPSKPVQIPVNQSMTVSQSSSDGSVSGSQPHLDFLGQEMADLQQVLISMASGESSAYSVNLCSSYPPSVHSSPLHQYAATGNVTQLSALISTSSSHDVNQPLLDGTSALHAAVQGGHEECVRILLESEGNPNSLREDLITPIHIAAGEGHYSCLKLLIEHNGDVHRTDQAKWTPLHWAATNGYEDCCRLLLDSGAKIDQTTDENWTPLHTAVNSGRVNTLKLLLKYVGTGPSIKDHSADKEFSESSYNLANLVDKDGWTIAHLAALRHKEDCLQVILERCPIDLDMGDNWGRTVYDVASAACKEFLAQIATPNSRSCTVSISMMPLPGTEDTSIQVARKETEVIVGTFHIRPSTTWQHLEDCVRSLLSNYFKKLELGLKTRKTSRLEPDANYIDCPPQPFTLGLSPGSVKQFSIGLYCWTAGAVFDLMPYEIMCNNNSYQIQVHLGDGDGAHDHVSFETLVPVAMVQNYLRLIEQYRSVVFYGPVSSGKSLLADRLANCVKRKEVAQGHMPEVIQVTCTESFTPKDLVTVLVEKGCIVNGKSSSADMNVKSGEVRAPILVLNELDKVNISEVFGDLLDCLEHRGENFAFKLKGYEDPEAGLFHFVDNFYLIATMDRTRSTGLELSVQQRFRWVHFRVDTEPIQHLLARHLQRRLIHTYKGSQPLLDDPVYKAVEWVVCVWQRLNDGLSKLGLPEVAFGPGLFFNCPMLPNRPYDTLNWLRDVWNTRIAPVVTDAVVKGTGAEASHGGQQKVANTALYVLMQRSVVSGCPITGSEREKYLSTFQGSNELDIPIRTRSHSNLDSFLSPNAPLSPTVQLKCILGMPSAEEGKKRHSSLQAGSQQHDACSPEQSNWELPHKTPSSRLTSGKSVSDTDLTASLPKVRRLEIRTPNLLSPGSVVSRSRSSSGSTIPRYSSLPVKLPSGSGGKTPSPGEGSSSLNRGSFKFPSTSTPTAFSFSNISTSPTFTTKLPRAVTVFKTTLSSVGQNGGKAPGCQPSQFSGKDIFAKGHSSGSRNKDDLLGVAKASPRLSSPRRYSPKNSSNSPIIAAQIPLKVGHDAEKETNAETGAERMDSSTEPPNPKSPKRDNSFAMPLHVETCSLPMCEPRTSPFRIIEPSPTVIPKDWSQPDNDLKTLDRGEWSHYQTSTNILNGPVAVLRSSPSPVVSPGPHSARVFLLSGHKTVADNTNLPQSQHSPDEKDARVESTQADLADVGNGSVKGHRTAYLRSDVIAVDRATGETNSASLIKTDPGTDLEFSPGRSEGKSAMEALAKVLQGEERVSLC